MKKKFGYSVKMRFWKNWLKRKVRCLIGIGISAAVPLLNACKGAEIVCQPIEREPITCIERIKTPLDMAKCLNEYKIRDESEKM